MNKFKFIKRKYVRLFVSNRNYRFNIKTTFGEYDNCIFVKTYDNSRLKFRRRNQTITLKKRNLLSFSRY